MIKRNWKPALFGWALGVVLGPFLIIAWAALGPVVPLMSVVFILVSILVFTIRGKWKPLWAGMLLGVVTGVVIGIVIFIANFILFLNEFPF